MYLPNKPFFQIKCVRFPIETQLQDIRLPATAQKHYYAVSLSYVAQFYVKTNLTQLPFLEEFFKFSIRAKLIKSSIEDFNQLSIIAIESEETNPRII